MKKKEIKELQLKTNEELKKMTDEAKAEIKKLTVEKNTGKQKNVNLVRNRRRDIARLLTIVRQKELSQT